MNQPIHAVTNKNGLFLAANADSAVGAIRESDEVVVLSIALRGDTHARRIEISPRTARALGHVLANQQDARLAPKKGGVR